MRITIRLALIIGFLVLIWGTSAITTSSTFLTSQTVLNDHARDIMENIADLAMEQSQNHLAHAHGAAALTRRLLTAEVVISSENNYQALEQYFLDQLAIYPHFAGIYVGKPNGDFYYVSRNSERSPGGFRTKVILNDKGTRTTRIIWRDRGMNAAGDEMSPKDNYDPRTRPWYKKAMAKKDIVWSDPYIFYTSQKPGITIAGPIYAETGELNGIIGVDIEIDQLSTFIGNLNIGKNGRAFMINNNGDVVAFPNLEKIKKNGQAAPGNSRLVKIVELDDILSYKSFMSVNLKFNEDGRYVLDSSRFASFEHNGRKYHAMLTPFSISQWPWIIGVHLPEDDYLGELKKNRLDNILLTLIISAIATISALIFSRSISRPITNLEKEAVVVKNDDMDTRFDLHSRYKEIQETADSFRLMKDAIKESTEKYRGIFENIQDVYYEITLDGIILEVSPSVERITDITRDELIGKNIYKYYANPADRDVLVREIIEKQQVKDYEVVLKDDRKGSEGFLSLNAVLKTDENGKPLKIIGSLRDVTARKKMDQELRRYREHLEELVKERTADLEKTNTRLVDEVAQRLQTEQALSENEEKYRNILESIAEGYFEIDLKGRFTFCNDAAARILGCSKEEFIGGRFLKYLEKDSARKAVSTFKEIFVTTKPRTDIELRITRKDGKKRYLELSASLIRNAKDDLSGFRGVGRDVTERIQAEKERQRLEEHLHQMHRLKSIGTLAGGIAHDFNNILMGIQGNVSLLLMSTEVTNENYDQLRNIEKCVQSGANLTRQLLGYARGGKYVVKPTNLNEIVIKSSNLFARTKKEIQISAEYQRDLWAVEVDRNQIEQVLVNLYLNAWQAMASGGTISLKTENVVLDDHFVKAFQGKPGRYIKLSLRDDGAGMDADTQKRIFEPFFTTKGMGKGTGLGLASVFGIIQNHNGIIDFESEVGRGTIYYIYLPATEKPIVVETEPEEKLMFGHETILVVDDEQYILKTCKAMLEKIGYRVVTAGGGKAAIDMMTKNQPTIDVVILDMIMPEMDGLKTYGRLKRINPGIKVIFSSGYSYEDIAGELQGQGATDFIQKPFHLVEISEKIRNILGKK